jgi:hypothetical protein
VEECLCVYYQVSDERNFTVMATKCETEFSYLRESIGALDKILKHVSQKSRGNTCFGVWPPKAWSVSEAIKKARQIHNTSRSLQAMQLLGVDSPILIDSILFRISLAS